VPKIAELVVKWLDVLVEEDIKRLHLDGSRLGAV
jgi:hypothetical protein